MLFATRRGHLKKAAGSAINQYFEEFIRNKDSYSEKKGYIRKLTAAGIAASYLANQNQHDPEKLRYYRTISRDYNNEHLRIFHKTKW